MLLSRTKASNQSGRPSVPAPGNNRRRRLPLGGCRFARSVQAFGSRLRRLGPIVGLRLALAAPEQQILPSTVTTNSRPAPASASDNGSFDRLLPRTLRLRRIEHLDAALPAAPRLARVPVVLRSAGRSVVETVICLIRPEAHGSPGPPVIRRSSQQAGLLLRMASTGGAAVRRPASWNGPEAMRLSLYAPPGGPADGFSWPGDARA